MIRCLLVEGIEHLQCVVLAAIAGEIARCWESRRLGGGPSEDARALAEANATGPPAVVEIFSPFSANSPSLRTLGSGADFGSPAASKAKAKMRAAEKAIAAASTLTAQAARGEQREPKYDALHLDPQVSLESSTGVPVRGDANFLISIAYCVIFFPAGLHPCC